MNFAVVETAKQYLIVSETWLDEDEKHCKYPRSLKDLKSNLLSHNDPEDDWRNISVVAIHGLFGN